MKKITYEYLYSKTLEIDGKLDNILKAVCYLKNYKDNISEILKIEYDKKYLKKQNHRQKLLSDD